MYQRHLWVWEKDWNETEPAPQTTACFQLSRKCSPGPVMGEFYFNLILLCVCMHSGMWRPEDEPSGHHCHHLTCFLKERVSPTWTWRSRLGWPASVVQDLLVSVFLALGLWMRAPGKRRRLLMLVDFDSSCSTVRRLGGWRSGVSWSAVAPENSWSLPTFLLELASYIANR